MAQGSFPPVTITTDREDAMYRTGEKVVFLLRKTGDALPDTLECAITWDGAAPVHAARIPASDLPREICIVPKQAGFLRCVIEWEGLDKSSDRAQAAAAVSPEEIPPSLPPPADFVEYWSEQLAAQAAMPMDATIIPHSEHPDGKIFNVRVPMPDGTGVYGWLLIPQGKPPFPAIARYHGAGVYAVPPENGLEWTARGIMVFSINPHAIPNDAERDFYLELRTGGFADYRTRGREDRSRVYFRTMFQRAVRAAEFLTSLPEWDGKHLIAEGHSQGGGQALAAAAFNSRVNGMVISCSTHCDHTGPVIGRVAGWPQFVGVENGVPNPMHVETARYIEGVNFASRVTCPTFWSVAFLDDLCPPTGNYAAYNQVAAPKTIRHDTATGHVHTDECKEATFRWVAEQTRRS